MTIFERAMELVREGDIIGLGTGRSATRFIHLLGERVRQGLRVQGVATSLASENLARSLNIPLTGLDRNIPLALTVDGADEVDLDLNLIKGYGRALVREKIVASSSRKLVILVGRKKTVPVLGTRGRLPVEVVPFALPLVCSELERMGFSPVVDQVDGKLFLTDNGNAALDCSIGPLEDPVQLQKKIRCLPGVVDTGLFLGMAKMVLVGDETREFALVEERKTGESAGKSGR